MKKFVALFIIVTLAFCSMSTLVYAGSLDDVISGNAGSSQTDTSTSGNYLTLINGLSDMSQMEEDIGPFMTKMCRLAGKLVQYVATLIALFLPFMVVLDLAYITFPFIRDFLSGGAQGQAQGGQQQAGMGGMGSMGGFGGGMGGFGGGGFGGGFGGGGFGGGMGGMGGMNGQQQGVPSTRRQIVSNAALNAVASIGQMGPDGKPINPYKLYAKEMIITLIVVPILLTLVLTGAFTQLGFVIGDFLVGAIASGAASI